MKLYLLNLYRYAVLAGPVCTVFSFEIDKKQRPVSITYNELNDSQIFNNDLR